MVRKRWFAHSPGFTYLEIFIVLALLGALLAIGVPNLFSQLNRSELEGTAKRTSMLFYKARIESIRRGVPVVVYPDYENRQVLAFADVNIADGTPGSDLLYNPIAGVTVDGATDYIVGRVELAPRAHFWGAPDDAPEGANVLTGFSTIGIDPPAVGAIFLPSGTLVARGALRFADAGRNFLEVTVSPEASPKVLLRKYDADATPGPDGTKYFPQGWNDQYWVWN